MAARRPSTREADSRSGQAVVDVRRPGTGEGSCGSRRLAGWTDNLDSCPSRSCCSRSASIRGRSARAVSDQ